jgi:hypothetical protein
LSAKKRISSYLSTAVFIALSSMLLMSVGVLGAIALYKVYLGSPDLYINSVWFIFSMILYYPIYKVLSKINYIWLHGGKISVAKVSMLGYGVPTLFPMEEKVCELKDIQSISSNSIFNNLVTIELTHENSLITIKSFFKKGEYQKFKALV